MHILGMGYAHPSYTISNPFIEAMDIGTNEEWIMNYIGVKNRQISIPKEYIAETRNQDTRKAREVASISAAGLGADAARMCLERAGVLPKDIGLVIVNCCTPKSGFPSEAGRIADLIGAHQAKVYDVFSACPAFALHMDYVRHFEDGSLPKYILCLSAATMTHKVNYNDRSDAAIWADGAAAYLLSPSEKGPLELVDSHFQADPLRCDAVVVPTNSHFKQDGRAVRDFSVRQTVRLIKRIEDEHKIDWTKDIFVGHQANKTMLDQITNNRDIPDSNHWWNVTDIGNQAGASAPAVLAMNWDKVKALSAGTRVVVTVVGAGLSWGSVVMRVRNAG